MNPGACVGPYLVLSRLGAGGMGEVWRARDERLGRDVAIKVLPAGFVDDLERLARFEREARATAALSHAHILCIYDVGVHDGQPYLVEELLEGESLRVRLLDGPLPVRDALSLGVQIARGLAAAHDKRIVHRDLKPDNVVVTPDGTAKILDFGLAKIVEAVSGDAATLTQAPTAATGPGQVMGSAAYMAPEQARGLAVDHRADLFAFGVLLHELLSGQRPFRGQTHSDIVAAILKDEPEPLPEVIPAAVRTLVRRCLEKRPEDRFSSARDLGFALQALIEGAPQAAARAPEPERPYPGLSAFAEGDAKRFFGRDEEIAALWRKLPSRSLLALIGPSGVGKTSFIRAGLVPHAPPGWRCIVATPGQAPAAALARELASSLAGDPDAVRLLVDFQDPDVAQRLIARWRQRSDHGLIVVDQFEELFTLDPEDVQARFAELVGSLAALAGVHVLLSMRDDFFFSCHRLPALSAVFQDVTPLGPPSAAGLRSALVEPARAMGFGFEDEALADDMVQAVEGERGALPLLAFAAASLWERRDLEARKLTRSAYDAIGGVAGALAQHAEATLDRVGADKLPLVRELFRNLVTSHQTRCVLNVEELLSVFPAAGRSAAREVVSRLVDARLLTEYEVDGADGVHHQRVELVHESLLSAWPRLARWRTEDEGGAQLRDQLRQTAHLWEERSRPEDLLWTGTSYQEYQVWRSRYPGGLSEVEEAFARAMTAFAGRRRRRRRSAVAAVLALLTAGLIVVGSFWRRSVHATLRAEAAQVLALGRLRLADNPTIALAHAVSSLELADNEPARRFALEALWQGPPARIVADPSAPSALRFSPDGRWLVLTAAGAHVLYDRGTGERRVLQASANEDLLGFTSDGRRLVSRNRAALPRMVVHFWTLPDGRLERTLERAEPDTRLRPVLVGDTLLVFGWDLRVPRGTLRATVRRLDLDGSNEVDLGTWRPSALTRFDIDADVTSLLVTQPGRLLRFPLAELASPGRVIGALDGDAGLSADWRDRVLTGSRTGKITIWDVPGERAIRELMSPADASTFAPDHGGRFVACSPGGQVQFRSLFLFDLAAPASALPVPLLTADAWVNALEFSPDDAWLVTQHQVATQFWNLRGPRSTVLVREDALAPNAVFTPDGIHVLAYSGKGALRRWPLDPADAAGPVDLVARPDLKDGFVKVAPGGRAAVLGVSNELVLVPLDGSPPRSHTVAGEGTFGVSLWGGWDVDPAGQRVAAYVVDNTRRERNALRIIDVATGAERVLDTHARPGEGCNDAGTELEALAMSVWLPDGRLVTDGDAGLQLWDLDRGAGEVLRPCRRSASWGWFPLLASPDGRSVLRLDFVSEDQGTVSSLTVFDLASRTTREITSHGNRLTGFTLSPDGAVLVTGDLDGVVRVGPLTGETPRLLFGHTAQVWGLSVSPDGKRLVSTGGTDVRLWDMPDLSRPPFHTLPHNELLARLRSLTNQRVGRDPASDTGWKIEVGPFPGWAVVPEWWP